MSAYGAVSRREAERLILAGRVTVNGEKAVTGEKAAPGRDVIRIDGIELTYKKEPVYIMLNKPPGYITTVRDDRGRKTVLELVSGAGARVYPVGRLDMHSEGLLLMTNDGEFANAVMHPSSEKKKVYEVDVTGDAAAAARSMRKPMDIEGRIIDAGSAELIRRTRDGGTLRIAIYEGRNRQIRKMCEKCGLTVKTLTRVSIGALGLGGLKPGQWRRLTPEEIGFFI